MELQVVYTVSLSIHKFVFSKFERRRPLGKQAEIAV
jgi:hypothetical protein